MADRKVLVRYYPPDFDPQKLREKSRELRKRHNAARAAAAGGVVGTVGSRPRPKLMNVRFMFPFTLCCDTCSEFVYIGTKFNSRVERAEGEDYLDVPVWRFYARCPHCRSEIVFRSDPQHTDYVLEKGGTRTFDPQKFRQEQETQEAAIAKEIEGDQVKALEMKSFSVANEIAATQALDDLRRVNRRLLFSDTAVENALQWLQQGGMEAGDEKKEEEQSELLVTAEEERELNEAREAMAERDLKLLYGEDRTLDILQKPAKPATEEEASKVTEGAKPAVRPHKLVGGLKLSMKKRKVQ